MDDRLENAKTYRRLLKVSWANKYTKQSLGTTGHQLQAVRKVMDEKKQISWQHSKKQDTHLMATMGEEKDSCVHTFKKLVSINKY